MEEQQFRVTVRAKQALGHSLPAQQHGRPPLLPPLSQWATIHNPWDRTFCYNLPEATASTRRPVQQALVLLTGTVTVATMVTATMATIMVTVTRANSGEKNEVLFRVKLIPSAMIAACNHKFSAYFTILVTMKIEDQTEHHISETGTNFHYLMCWGAHLLGNEKDRTHQNQQKQVFSKLDCLDC